MRNLKNKRYKNWIIILYLLFVMVGVPMVGCATLEGLKTNYEQCVNDVECQKQMEMASTATGGVAAIVSGILVSPISVPITGLVILLTTLITGVYLGNKKNKPKPPETPVVK